MIDCLAQRVVDAAKNAGIMAENYIAVRQSCQAGAASLAYAVYTAYRAYERADQKYAEARAALATAVGHEASLAETVLPLAPFKLIGYNDSIDRRQD